MSVSIEQHVASSLARMRDGLPKATREAWRAAGDEWHANILPKHFRLSAMFEYQYRQRTVKHMKRKAKRFGHQDPLVFTGALKKSVLSIRDVRPSATGARVVLHGPKYLHMYRKSLKLPSYASELSAVSTRDVAILAKVIEASVTGALNATTGEG